MLRIGTAAIAIVCFLSSAASAGEVGTVAAVEGGAEIQHLGRWSPAEIGGAIQVGDAVRTGPDGRVRVVFQDDSVLNVANSSFVVVDRQIFDPGETGSRSLMKLLRGKVRALVSEYYEQPGAAYEIETETAVAGVRGTEFVVEYDPEVFHTAVVGVSGKVEVHSVLDRARHGVYVTAGERTEVRRGQFPSPAPRLDEDTFRQYLEGLEFIGFGRPESLTAENAVATGVEVPAPEQAPPVASLTVSPSTEGPERDASTLVDQPTDVIRSITGDLVVRF